MQDHANHTPWLTLAIVAAVVVRFLVRDLRDRRMRAGPGLFVVPAFVGALALLSVGSAAVLAPSHLPELAIGSLVSAVVGAGIGLAVAHFTTVRAAVGDAARDTVVVRGSYATVAIWVAALALRFGARYAVGVGARGEATAANASLVVMIATIVFVVRYRVLVEGRAVLAAHRTEPVAAL